MSHKKNKSQSIVCVIVAFILSVFLTMACYICGLFFGLLNTGTIIDSLDGGTYYDDIIDYTVDTSESFAILLGLPETVFDEVFDVSDTRDEVHKFVNSTMEGKDYVPNTDKAKKRLVENVNKYIEENGYEITEEQQGNVDTFAENVCEVYSESMKIPFFKYFVSVKDVVSDVIVIALPVFVVLSILAIFILFKAQKWKHRSLRYINYSTIAAAVMTAGLPLYILNGGIYKRITISPKYVYDFIVTYIDKSLTTFLWVSGVLAAISVVLIYVAAQMKKRVEKKAEGRHHHHHHRESEESEETV